METSGHYSKLNERDFFDLLLHAVSGSSEDHRHKRMEGLEELQRRIKSNSIQANDEAIRILIEMARKQGSSRPEGELITESFLLIVKKDDCYYQTILNELEPQNKEDSHF